MRDDGSACGVEARVGRGLLAGYSKEGQKTLAACVPPVLWLEKYRRGMTT